MTQICWRKSSRSGQEGNCVELANTFDIIRDSKNPNGPTLTVNTKVFMRMIKNWPIIEPSEYCSELDI
jgi:hypothetical protein